MFNGKNIDIEGRYTVLRYLYFLYSRGTVENTSGFKDFHGDRACVGYRCLYAGIADYFKLKLQRFEGRCLGSGAAARKSRQGRGKNS